MKSISRLFLLMLTVAIAFSSCGGDDDGPAPIKKTEELTYTYQIPIEGINNSQTTPPAVIFKLDSLLKDHTKNFVSGEFQRGKCSLEVKGLSSVSTTATLKDFTITIGNRGSVNLGDCSPTAEFMSDTKLSGDKYTNLIKFVFDDFVSQQKSSSVKITFTPTETILAKDHKVFLNITVTGIFTYNVYEGQ